MRKSFYLFFILLMSLLIGCGKTTDISEIVFSEESVQIDINEEYKIKYGIIPNNSDERIYWESVDEDVATVDEEGNIKGVSEGNTVIIASTSEGINAKCKVTVVAIGKEAVSSDNHEDANKVEKQLEFNDIETVKKDIIDNTDIVSFVENFYPEYYFCLNNVYLNYSEYMEEGYRVICTVEFTGSEDMLSQDYEIFYVLNEQGNKWELSDYQAVGDAMIVSCIEDTSDLEDIYFEPEIAEFNFSGTWVAYSSSSGKKLLVYTIPKQSITYMSDTMECYYSVIDVSSSNGGAYYGLVTTIPTYGVIDWNKRIVEVRGDGTIGGTGGYGYYGDLYFDTQNISYFNKRYLVNIDSYGFSSIDELANYVKANGHDEFIGPEGKCE